jgi:hypothetical protein
MPVTPPRFAFVQLDVPGDLGLAEGRYLVRKPRQAVLVVQVFGAPAAEGGRYRRRPRSREARADEGPSEVPVTRLTAIRSSEPLADAAEGTRWLEATVGAADAVTGAVAEGLTVVNAALHAHGVAAQDSRLREVDAEAAMSLRLGHGRGDALADGRWDEAREVTLPEPRRRRSDALHPQERVAAVLGGREELDACETLLLRARADLDQGRLREAALQLQTGLDALLSELPGDPGPDQEEDLAWLSDRRTGTAALAGRALRGAVGEDDAAELAETLRVCERVLRRRRILSE